MKPCSPHSPQWLSPSCLEYHPQLPLRSPRPCSVAPTPPYLPSSAATTPVLSLHSQACACHGASDPPPRPCRLTLLLHCALGSQVPSGGSPSLLHLTGRPRPREGCGTQAAALSFRMLCSLHWASLLFAYCPTWLPLRLEYYFVGGLGLHAGAWVGLGHGRCCLNIQNEGTARKG